MMFTHIENNQSVTFEPRKQEDKIIRKLLNKINHWRQNSRTRAMLATLDNDALKDIGISRVDALQESNKPFWQ